MTTNFNTSLSEFGEKFVTRAAPLTAEEKSENRSTLYTNLVAEFFEQLILFDRVAIKIEQDNIPLAILIEQLGLELVLECIQDGTIELWLWTQVIFITGGMEGKGIHDDSYIKGIPPLSVGRLSSRAHSDPEKSVMQCFKWMSHIYSNEERKRFAQKVAHRIKLDTDDIANPSRNLILAAYKANDLATCGLPFNKDPNDLNYQERKTFMKLASDVIDTTFLASHNFTSFNKYNSTLIAQSSLDKIGKAFKLKDGLTRIIELEKVPDLRSVFIQRKIDFYNAVKFRNTAVSKKFRAWLSTATDSKDIEYITKQYIDELVSQNGFFDSNKAKLLKTIAMTTTGVGLGAILAKKFGTNPATSIAIEGGLGLALGSFEDFILGKLGKGWTPRMFIDAYKNELTKFE